MPDIPDGGGTYAFNYSIGHLGSKFKILKKPELQLEVDYYHNFEDYSSNDSIPANLSDERDGLTVGLSLGSLKRKGNYLIKLTYAYLERYSAVDYYAQNDWARWDYSNFDSPDGRLTNLWGLELVTSYMVTDNIKLTMKYYHVNQLVAYGIEKENGDRIRFDIDIKF